MRRSTACSSRESGQSPGGFGPYSTSMAVTAADVPLTRIVGAVWHELAPRPRESPSPPER
jgi:hypothetical protein